MGTLGSVAVTMGRRGLSRSHAGASPPHPASPPQPEPTTSLCFHRLSLSTFPVKDAGCSVLMAHGTQAPLGWGDVLWTP